MIALLFFVMFIVVIGYFVPFNSVVKLGNKRVLLKKKNTKQLECLDKIFKDIDSMICWCMDNSYPDAIKAETLKKNWDTVTIVEIDKGGSIASVIGKNLLFRICIDEIEKNENVFKFVFFHELAHMMSPIYGHGIEFQRDFRTLLDTGKKLNIYDPISLPTVYCDFNITSSP
jgi:hypothetical protein